MKVIPDRTSEQVRSHAQKYLKKQEYDEQQREATRKALESIEKGEGRPVRERKAP